MTKQKAESKFNKIKSVEELAEVAAYLRKNKRTIVHCHGVFDLLHIGHIRHFNEAKKLGDVLVVTVTSDRYVNKGPHHPAFTGKLRAEAIASLGCVDYVAVNDKPTAVDIIKIIKPAVYAKGADYKNADNDHTGEIRNEEAAVKVAGGRIAFTDDITFSSSNLINRYMPVLDGETSNYLSAFTKRHSVDDVLGYLKKAQSTKILVIGESIIDEYQYCTAIGKSAKEPILAAQYLSTEKFAGGVLAIANHLSNFCEKVGLLTMLGEQNTQEEFVRENIGNDVEKLFFYKVDSPTIVKRRFVESYLLQKLFEVYDMNDEELSQKQDETLCAMLENAIPRYDVVVVADYGHGFLSKNAINVLCNKAHFLAVNTQVNAGNKGFNIISKYPRADYISLAKHEIALEERNQRDDVKEMIQSMLRKIDCDHTIITCGKDGNVGYSTNEGFVEIPSFTDSVVDRMGAGDAVLPITALCVSQQAPMEIVGFIGNAVGAQAVAILGHQRSIERAPLFKFIESLLK